MIRTMLITAVILCALLVCGTAMAQVCPVPTEKPELARTWINLDKASALLKQPGKKVIMALGVEKSNTNKYDFMPDIDFYNQFDYYSDIIVVGPNGDRVKILDNAFGLTLSEKDDGGMLCFSPHRVIKIDKDDNNSNTEQLVPILISADGIEELPHITDARVTWFSSKGYFAFIDYQNVNSETGEPGYQQFFSLSVKDHKDNVIKSFDLTKYFKPFLGYGNVTFHPEGVIIQSSNECYLFRLNTEPEKLDIKLPTIPPEDSVNFYFNNEQNDPIYAMQNILHFGSNLTILGINRKIDAISRDFNNNKTKVMIEDILVKRAEDKYFSPIGLCDLPKALGYSNNLDHMVFYNSNCDVADINIKTSEVKIYKIEKGFKDIRKNQFDRPFTGFFYNHYTNEPYFDYRGVLYRFKDDTLEVAVKEDVPIIHYSVIM